MSGRKYTEEERAEWRALGYSDAIIDEHEALPPCALRNEAVPQELIDRTLRALDAGFLVGRFIRETVIATHREDRWRDRRRLRKALRTAGIVGHLRACTSCRTLAGDLRQAMDVILTMTDRPAAPE